MLLDFECYATAGLSHDSVCHTPRPNSSLTVNGETEILSAKCMSERELRQWLEVARGCSGEPVARLRKTQHTDRPSIQGVWTPWTNVPPQTNLETFPSVSVRRASQGRGDALETPLVLVIVLTEIGINLSWMHAPFVQGRKKGRNVHAKPTFSYCLARLLSAVAEHPVQSCCLPLPSQSFDVVP